MASQRWTLNYIMKALIGQPFRAVGLSFWHDTPFYINGDTAKRYGTSLQNSDSPVRSRFCSLSIVGVNLNNTEAF